MIVRQNPLKTVPLLAFALGVYSCIYEYDDCPKEQNFSIVNDWTFARDAHPEGMAYIFFHKCSEEQWRFDFPGMSAGAVMLPFGEYSFLSFNDDTCSVRFHDSGGFDEYVAYTDEADRTAFNDAGLFKAHALPDNVSSEAELLMECPDMMWGCAYRNLLPKLSTDMILTVFQRQLTSRYSYVITDVVNLDGVRALSAVFSGLAGSLNLATGIKSIYPVMLPSRAYASDDTTIKGEFVTFGLPEHPDANNILSLFVLLKDGRKFMYQFDVTDNVRSAPDPFNVSVRINGLRLEESKEDVGEGAFDVNVDDWITIRINING